MNKKSCILLPVILGAIGSGILVFLYLSRSNDGIARPGKALVRYDIPKYGSELPIEIMSSPFDANVLWLLNQNSVSCQFSIDRNEWQELSKQLGTMANGLKKEEIVPDPCLPGQIWIANSREGLGLYDASGKKKKVFGDEMFDYSAITALAFTRDDVWIGVSDGLYRYVRATDTLCEITPFKEVWVKYLDIDGDSLIVNRKFIYNPGSNKVENVSAVTSAKIAYQHGLRISSQDGGLLVSDAKGLVIAELAQTAIDNVYIDPTGGIWRAGDGLAKFDPQSHDLVTLFTERVSNLQYSQGYLFFSCRFGLGRIQLHNNRVTVYPEKDLLDYTIVRNHLWLLTKDGLLRLTNQDGHFQSITAFDRIKAQETELGELLWSIRGDGEDGIVMLVKRAAAFVQRAEALDFPLDDNTRYTLTQFLRLGSNEDRKEIEDYLLAAENRFEKEICLYLLATGPMLLGDPVAAYDNYNRLKADYPESVVLGLIISQDAAILAKTSEEYQKIIQATMPEDERLWRLGRLFCDAATVEWNMSDTFYNRSLGYSYYRKLIETYPESQWADDADYELFAQFDLHDGEYYYSPCVEKLQDLINKYPDSEYVANAKYLIGSHYCDYVQGMLGERRRLSYGETQKCLLGAKEAFLACLTEAGNEERQEEIRHCLAEIERLQDELSLELQLTAARERYKLGEEIVLSIQLKNMSGKPRAIELFGESPQFGLIVYCYGEDGYDQIDFLRDLNAPLRSKTKRVTLPPGGVFAEEQTPGIAAVAESDWSALEGAVGKLLFDRVGTYDVMAYYWEQGKNGKLVFASEQIKIVVER